jgi:uncharacterized membrane protein YhhN
MLPFAGGFAAVPNGLLIFSGAASFLFLMLLRQPASPKRAMVKAAGVLTLALVTVLTGGPWALLAALLLAAAGDYLLAFDDPSCFQFGLSSFLLAQMALVVLFFTHYEGLPALLFSQPWRAALALAALAHSVYLARRLWQELPRDMGAQIVAYACVITLMALAALTYAPVIVVAGAALFYLSDTLIAYERFILDVKINEHPVIAPAIWVTYYAAQVAITLGVIL